jgi:hypothetical protein
MSDVWSRKSFRSHGRTAAARALQYRSALRQNSELEDIMNSKWKVAAAATIGSMLFAGAGRSSQVASR